MKYDNSFVCIPAKRIIHLLILISILSFSCNKNKIHPSFYYSGNTKIEITISKDTFGVLLKDTVLNPAASYDVNFNTIKKLADSNLNLRGYVSAGYLDSSKNIKLLVSPNNNKTFFSLEKEAKQLKGQNNKIFISNAGYLARIKGTNKPIIITDEIIIKFKPGTSDLSAIALLDSFGLARIRKDTFAGLQYTVSTTKNSPHDALRISQILKQNAIVKYAQLNFIYAKKFFAAALPNDTYFPNQWNLLNTGANGATPDADIDAELAWNFTMGSHDVTIAVIDEGFDMMHSDLAPNFSHNRMEIPNNNIDDDNNGYIDDMIGWNFNGNNNDLEGNQHGTAVIGIANAVGNNNLGIIGSCPNCSSIPLKSAHLPDGDQQAIEYAQMRHAKVINCSWDYGGMPAPDNVIEAMNNALNAGIVFVCAMTNDNSDYCSTTPNLAAVPNIILVSRSTSNDTYDQGGWGDCMSLLAPSGVNGSPPQPGLLKVTTTDITGELGYNDGTYDQLCDNALPNADFTGCFWGTSGSAPLTAGVIGLILSANNTLSPQQVKYLLQDCSDKIQESIAKYSPINGKSTTGTHGYGRLNAYEAVKIASPQTTIGGRNGVDIFIRDNYLDWGNTEQPSNTLFEGNPRGFIPHWKSPDIKVDAPDASNHYQTPTNSAEFESFTDENPLGGATNKVYVKVRNRGFRTASNVSVKLYWVYGGTALPALWPTFPQDMNDDPNWHFLGTRTIANIPYSGSSIAGTTDDMAQIATFDFNAPIPDLNLPNHYCLLAMIGCDDDPLVTNGNSNLDMVTPYFNNITHKNYAIATASSSSSQAIYMNNPYDQPVQSMIVLKNPQNIRVKFENTSLDSVLTLRPHEKRLMKFRIENPEIKQPSEFTIQQEIFLNEERKGRKVRGGFTFYFRK